MACGVRTPIRTTMGRGTSEHGNLEFAVPDISGWLGRLRSTVVESSLSGIFPIYAFAITILVHPLADGNGRLARGLMHAAFCRRIGSGLPLLPLAPAFYLHSAGVRDGVRKVAQYEEWDELIGAATQVLETAVRLRMSLDDAICRSSERGRALCPQLSSESIT
ncbi:MAG: hypothetical protein ABL926_02655 [Novosphingobium sp.]|uniref:hypothetical protein n=1 Tax=Novosphingobium sp. TaxID=1874826 RepID=UPI0032B77C6F